MKSIYVRSITLMLAVLLLPQMARASSIVTITFNQPTQSVTQGGFLTFTGTLSITGDPTPVAIFGDTVLTSPGFGLVCCQAAAPDLIMLDDFPFLLFSPLQVSSDGANGPSSSTFDFFTVDVGSLVTPGTYLGEFDVVGDDFLGGSTVIASTPFQIDVTAPVNIVPEPGSLVLLCTGIAVVALRFRATRFATNKVAL